jgi:EAL domain-containing protein (putative c-di-GMP-specific phosphodiesterase class I)
MVIDRESEAYRQMQLLRNQGVFISIDDFGTGFSSLSYLHRLQIDAVKLDRSFVQSIDTDEAAQRLVRAMIGVAQGLGLEVIAEGVETEEQRLQLVAVGCPVMQGFLFARPDPPEGLEDLLAVTTPAGDLTRLYGSLEAAAMPVAEATSA